MTGTPKIEIYTDGACRQNPAIEALGFLKRGCVLTWYTDAKKPVKNADLCRSLDAGILNYDVNGVWKKGLSGNQGNEMADQLASRGIDQMLAS
jgi:ribonuclease HI